MPVEPRPAFCLRRWTWAPTDERGSAPHSLWASARADQIAFVREQPHGVAVRRQVDARSRLQPRHFLGHPDLSLPCGHPGRPIRRPIWRSRYGRLSVAESRCCSGPGGPRPSISATRARPRAIATQFQHEAADQQRVLLADGCGGRVVRVRQKPLSPIDFSSRGHQRRHRLACPDDELPFAPRRNHDRRTVRHRLVERFPDLLPRILFQRNDASSRFASCKENQQITLDQRRRSAALRLISNSLSNLFSHSRLAGRRLETMNMSVASDHVQLACLDNRRGGRWRSILGHEIGILGLIRIRPQRFAGRLVKTMHALLGRASLQLHVRNKHLALRHHGT